MVIKMSLFSECLPEQTMQSTSTVPSVCFRLVAAYSRVQSLLHLFGGEGGCFFSQASDLCLGLLTNMGRPFSIRKPTRKGLAS